MHRLENASVKQGQHESRHLAHILDRHHEPHRAYFPHAHTADDLAAGAIVALREIKLLPRTLITDAAALTGPDLDHRRPDFTLAEMRSGPRSPTSIATP